MRGPAAQQQLTTTWTFIYSCSQASGLKTVPRPHVLQLWAELGLLRLSCCCPGDVRGGLVCVHLRASPEDWQQ